MKPKPNAERLTKTLMLTLLLTAGCASPHLRLDNSRRLTERPDFPQAAQAAPEWCRDALKTINALELELERK
jgi:hypothetical protein